MAPIMDFDSPDIDACLASYMPLSNLPTPPPSSEHHAGLYECYNGSASSMFDAYTVETVSPNQKIAEYLVGSLPSNLANYNPSAANVASYLDRACLPDSIVGLAICILETLSSRFVRSWRQSSFYAAVTHHKAEVVIVAALAVASAFADDLRREASWWSNSITWGDFTMKQINVSVRCVLADIEYNLHPFTPDMMEDAIQEARGNLPSATGDAEAAKVDAELGHDHNSEKHDTNKERSDADWSGGAIWEHGLVTPEPSPVEGCLHFLQLT